MRRTLRRLAVPLAVAALVSAAAPSHANTTVHIDGRDFSVEGVSVMPGGDAPAGDLDAVFGLAAYVAEQLPTKPCVPTGVDMTIGDLTGTGLADLANPGDIYYLWKSPTTVKIKGNCDKETISRVTYIDKPLIGTGTPAKGGPYEARATGDVTVMQAPEWLVLYYSSRSLYTRALFGSVEVKLVGSYIDAKTNAEVVAGCKTKTWYFWTTPSGPSYSSSHEAGC